MEEKMKKQCKHTCRTWSIAITAVILLGLSAGIIYADEPIMKIDARPLTPQEIDDYGLTNTTQIASGNHVVGLGQPVYLEFLVQKGVDGGRHPVDFVTVTQTVWSLDSVLDEENDPIVSAAVITNSPLGIAIPAYDGGHQQQFDIIDRAVIVPDVKGTYAISLEAMSISNGTFNLDFEVVGSVFIGKDYYLCTICHQDKTDAFNLTDHSQAFKNQITGAGSSHFASYCIKCHVVGYDDTPGAVNGGFDDVAADEGWTFPETLSSNNWDDMPVALQNVSNIQCENCHGPADEHMQSLGDISRISVNFSAGNCGQCHDKLTHHVKNTEWVQTPHAKGYVFRGSGSCAPCHSTVGYIDANDPSLSWDGKVVDNVGRSGTGYEGVTCAACHDPHTPGAGAHQLRDIGSVTLANGFEITQGGDGLICMACHHDRYEAEDRASQGRTPHHGTQTDLLFGQNAIEYGQDMPSSRHWDAVEDSCTQCHMQELEHGDVPDYAEHKVGGHSFMLSYNDETNSVIHLTETCKSCHGEIEDFNFGGADYDQDGAVEGVQTEISDMLYDLAIMLPPVGIDTVDDDLFEEAPYTAAQTTSFEKANYNRLMIIDDGSLGVHNPKYIAALLRSSIDDVKGGIDIDRDGLVDEWEIAVFGNLTIQSGTDDWDEDGLNNMVEFKLGTNAKLADSDFDGFADIVELQGNSDPMDGASVPSSDLILLSAAEIGYLPKGTGTTVNIQMVSDLTDGVWTNIGEDQVSTGNWIYELDSMRGTTNRFYRAIEE